MTIQHYVSKYDKFISVSYLKTQNRMIFISFYIEQIARHRNGCEIGIWKLKSLKTT